MAHRIRLAALVIDCRTDDLTGAIAFWSGALGRAFERTEDGRYAVSTSGRPAVILQAVEHEPRAHLDLETDDAAAELARLERLGARPVDHKPRWMVMEAPTGHRFCVGGPNEGFDADAREVD